MENKDKLLKVLVPFQVRIPDKFEIRFEDKDEICDIYYSEEFTSKNATQEECNKTLAVLGELLQSVPNLNIKLIDNGIQFSGEVPTTLGISIIISELMGQAVYYIGKQQLLDILNSFPDDKPILPVLQTFSCEDFGDDE